MDESEPEGVSMAHDNFTAEQAVIAKRRKAALKGIKLGTRSVTPSASVVGKDTYPKRANSNRTH